MFFPPSIDSSWLEKFFPPFEYAIFFLISTRGFILISWVFPLGNDGESSLEKPQFN